ncbi:MAG: hypothetical protein ACREF4_17605, partial [Gammaproteobacteria bacterium]
MNPQQRAVLFVGSFLTLLAVLFPPWSFDITWEPLRRPRIAGGYWLIFSPPNMEERAAAVGLPPDQGLMV